MTPSRGPAGHGISPVPAGRFLRTSLIHKSYRRAAVWRRAGPMKGRMKIVERLNFWEPNRQRYESKFPDHSKSVLPQ